MRDYLLPLAIVLAAVILAVAFRYAPGEGLGGIGFIIDRWTGCASPAVYTTPSTASRCP